jgi:hypothetical protein
MTRFSGYVFDTYDDTDGHVLKSIVESPGRLPPLVKTAARLTEAQINELSDDQFALVLFDGTYKMKKYATVDRGNTILSVLYLIKQAHTMPDELAKTAAHNLTAALDMYDLPIPDELVKLARKSTNLGIPSISERRGPVDPQRLRRQYPELDEEPSDLGGAAGFSKTASHVPGKSQKPFAANAKVHKLQYPEVLEEPKESHDNPQLGRHDAAWDDVTQRTNVEGTPGNNVLELPAFSGKEKIKTANQHLKQLFGSSYEASAAERANVNQLFDTAAQTKQQSWRESPYFDVSGWDPSMPGVPETTAPERTLLDGVYPIDGYDQVKTASTYFDDNWSMLPGRDRHKYCVKLASRMAELGLDVPEKVARYGSTTYAADVDSYVESRRSYVHEEAHPALDTLLEKRAQVSPGVFAEALAEFDRINDLNWYWDSKIPDPWFSTFGPSIEKIAAENWSWDGLGIRVNEEELKQIARNEFKRISANFGESFAKEFSKSPKDVFMSLPEPNKIILARLASDRLATTE